MLRWFRKKRMKKRNGYASLWKQDFSDCVTSDYLPGYSVCLCGNNRSCRYVALYSGMMLCSHPEHKRFIPEDAVPFDPHKGQFRS